MSIADFSTLGPGAAMGDDEEDDRRALDELFSATYEELKRLAASVRTDFPRSTLNPTALVNEAWAKLARSPRFAHLPRIEFRRIAAHAMRQVLVEAARRRGAHKRGPTLFRVTFDEALAVADSDAQQIIEIDEALEKLAAVDPKQAEVVEHRFFAGNTNAEIAELMGMSESSVERAWRAASAWLNKNLHHGR
jgi:RNA polymerase sigma factor (TIGR02999 family)